MTEVGLEDSDALPEPPADLAARRLPLVWRAVGERFVRVHRKTDGSVWFGLDAGTATFRMATNRFDSPNRHYGVLYVAATRDGAFAQSVGRVPRIFRSNDELAALRITTLALTRDIRVVDLHGGAAVGTIGVTGVVGVSPQSLARRWSQALHDHPDMPDGIEYRCRHNSDELALALFDRVGETVFAAVAEEDLTSDGDWLSAMRTRHQIWQPPS